jgi:hypothetical protein
MSTSGGFHPSTSGRSPRARRGEAARGASAAVTVGAHAPSGFTLIGTVMATCGQPGRLVFAHPEAAVTASLHGEEAPTVSQGGIKAVFAGSWHASGG